MHEPLESSSDRPKPETRQELSIEPTELVETGALQLLRSDVLQIPRLSAVESLARREIVFIMGGDARLLFGSTALYSALGYDAHQLQSRSLFELMDSEDAADLAGLLEAIEPRSESPTRVRLELRHSDGSSYVLVGTTTAIHEEGFGRSYIMRVRIAAVNAGC